MTANVRHGFMFVAHYSVAFFLICQLNQLKDKDKF